MKRLTLVAAPLLAVGLVGGTAAVGWAHTPNPSISCSGISIGGSAYGSQGADWTLTVAGESKSGHFGDSGSSPVIHVPQDGATTSWSYSIKAVDGNAAGTKSDSGSVGPCGTPPVVKPPKPDDIVTHDSSDDKNCDTRVITTHHTTTTTTYTYDEKSNTWIKGEPVTTNDADTTRPATDTECPPVVVIPPKPEDVVKQHTSEEAADCATKTVTIHHATTTVTSTYNEATNTWDLHTNTVKNPDTTRPATAKECPVVVIVVPPPVAPPVPPVVVPPVFTPHQPIPHVVHPLVLVKPKVVDAPRSPAKPAVAEAPGVLPNTGMSGTLAWLSMLGVSLIGFGARKMWKNA